LIGLVKARITIVHIVTMRLLFPKLYQIRVVLAYVRIVGEVIRERIGDYTVCAKLLWYRPHLIDPLDAPTCFFVWV